MTTPTTVYDRARELLRSGDVDLLTSDVFDTLVWRPAAKPHHLFRLIGRELVARGWVPDHVGEGDVLGARILAERRAREHAARAHGCDECTLEEIWDEMPAAWFTRPIGDLIAVELGVETANLRPIDAGCDLLREAADAGVAIVLVSDTYLSPGQLHDLLAATGVPVNHVATIVTSSAERLNKLNGLIARTIAKSGASSDRTLHVGDHPVADVSAATEAGATAIRLDDCDPTAPTTPMAEALEQLSATTGSDGGATALARALRLSDGAGTASRPPHDAAYDFGVDVGGPLLTGFADWLVDRADDLDVTRIHYLLREGAFLADVVAAAHPNPPEARLVHASRWMTMRASVVTGSPDEIFRAVARRAHFHPSHVVEAFGLDPKLVHSVIGGGRLDDKGRIRAVEALAADDECREAIVASAATLRRRLVNLYQRELAPEDGRVVLCDIGWGGTIQEGLGDLLRHEGWDIEVIGLYLMLSTPGRHRVQRGARMYGFLPDESEASRDAYTIMRAPEIAEQLCTPELATFVDLGPDGPVLADSVGGAVESRRRARQGVLDFATARRAAGVTAPRDPARALLRGFAGTLQRPGARLAAELAEWVHDDVGGTGYEQLVDTSATWMLQYANAAELDLIGMRDLYWVAGAAALADTSLAAQIESIDMGLDPDDVCPPSELGTARIAVFPPDGLDAVAQIERIPRRNGAGWSMLRLVASVDDVRVVRFDAGADDALVEIGTLRLTRGDATVTIDQADDPRIEYVGGHAIGGSLFAVRAGGYLVVAGDSLPPAPSDGLLDAVFAFRSTPLDEHAAARLGPTWRQRGEQLARRGRQRLSRRR